MAQIRRQERSGGAHHHLDALHPYDAVQRQRGQLFLFAPGLAAAAGYSRAPALEPFGGSEGEDLVLLTPKVYVPPGRDRLASWSSRRTES